jgi:hypothetical protein
MQMQFIGAGRKRYLKESRETVLWKTKSNNCIWPNVRHKVRELRALSMFFLVSLSIVKIIGGLD